MFCVHKSADTVQLQSISCYHREGSPPLPEGTTAPTGRAERRDGLAICEMDGQWLDQNRHELK